MNRCSIEARQLPQFSGNGDRIKLDRFPPCRLIASPMEGTMMGPAQRDRKLIADPTPQVAWLHEPQMMRVRRAPSADKAGLCRNEPQVLSVAVAARFAQGERALVDMPGNRIVHAPFRLSGCGRRLHLIRCRRRRWRLPTGPPFADIPICRQRRPRPGLSAPLSARCRGQHWHGGRPTARHELASHPFRRGQRHRDWR
jgi:hypothetical protein